MKLPALRLVRTYAGAITYSFRVDNDFGWALCTVNDMTGELAITSDWGNWSHAWSPNPKNLGAPTFTAFLACRADCYYLADKLTSRGQRERFDAAATVAELRRRLCESRLERGRRYAEMSWTKDPWALDVFYGQPLTKQLAREIWDDMDALLDVNDSTLFVERFMQIDGCGNVSEEPWEHTRHVPETSYTVLVEAILPALITACEATLAERAEDDAERASQEITAS